MKHTGNIPGSSITPIQDKGKVSVARIFPSMSQLGPFY